MEEKLFSIIVPTYNRGEILRGCLKAILPFVRTMAESVSVYVSDNASTDNTQSVVESFMSEYSDILYYKRQKTNVGMFNNFRDAACSVNSRYIALVGDDDKALPYYVSTIVSLLKQYPNVGLINVNLLSVSEHGYYLGTRDKVVAENHVKLYSSGGDFLKEHLIVPSLISSNVFLKNDFVKTLVEVGIDDYPGYDWFYAMMLSVINKPCLYYDLPLLIQRQPDGDNMRWIDQAPLYHIYGFGRMFHDLDKYSKGLEELWKSNFVNSSTAEYLLHIISRNKKIYKDKYEQLKDFSPNRKYSILLYLYIHYPSSIVNLARKLFKCFCFKW